MKIVIIEMSSFFDWFISILNIEKERISEFEDLLIEIIKLK